MIDKIIVLGNHVQALGILRFAKELGKETILFNNHLLSISRFSINCSKYQIFKDHEDLLNKLLKICDKGKNALIIPTNDNMVLFILNNYSELEKYFYLPYEGTSSVDIFYNKIKTYRHALAKDIPIPQSFFPSSEKDIIKISTNIDYPVILKPAIMYTFYKKTGKKVIICNTMDDLFKSYLKLRSLIPKEEIIIQEYLQGGPQNLFSFGSYAVNGKVIKGFAVNRIRQNPMDFGASTSFAYTVEIPEIEISAEKLLKTTNYTGVSEIEFMYDNKTGEYKLLEVNPRFWKWHYIAKDLGINFVDLMIRHLEGNSIANTTYYYKYVAWEERITDYYIMIKEYIKGNMSISEILKTFRTRKIFAVWSWKDPLPAIIYLLLLPYLYIKRT